MEDKPKIGEAPPEPVKPEVKGDTNPSFSYRELDLIEVTFIDGYKYLSFMVNGEFIVLIREFDYYSYLSFIFNEIEIIQAEGGECICDICEPNFTVIEENHKILAQKFDIETDSVIEEKDKFIKIYEIHDLQYNTFVGIHEGGHKEEDNNKH